MATLPPRFQELRRSLSGTQASGVTPTGVPGVTFFWYERSLPRAPPLYSTGIVIIGRGRKVGYLGGRRFQYDAGTCLVLGGPVPFECEVHATPEEPLLGIRVDIDRTMLHGLVARFPGQLGFEDRIGTAPHAGVEPVRMAGTLLQATVRLLECLRDPMDRR